MATRSDPDTDGWVVSGMNLAAFLWHKGHPLFEVWWEGDLCRWRFGDTPKLHRDVTAFEAGHAMVDPRQYWRKIHEFKQLSYGAKP